MACVRRPIGSAKFEIFRRAYRTSGPVHKTSRKPIKVPYIMDDVDALLLSLVPSLILRRLDTLLDVDDMFAKFTNLIFPTATFRSQTLINRHCLALITADRRFYAQRK